ncbi:MAG: c-type cytochrome [Chloroflexota bacterium]|jgi:cytochrome c553|nr:cytochrome c [Dehalococcoidia bacterium]MEC7747971.1 c-type cytochrome [Chloroflexota bacterium]
MMNRAEQNPVLSRTRTGQVKRGLRRWFFGVAMLFGIVLVGCSQGSYPLDIFYEQHYQQSYRSHEPPRLIGVADAVAFYPPTTSTVTNTGADLFRVNCQMCHGSDAKGTGPVLARIINSYGYQPIVDTNITTRPVSFIASRLEAESRPLGPSSVMPPFGKLLSENERNAIAEYVGSLPK